MARINPLRLLYLVSAVQIILAATPFGRDGELSVRSPRADMVEARQQAHRGPPPWVTSGSDDDDDDDSSETAGQSEGNADRGSRPNLESEDGSGFGGRGGGGDREGGEGRGGERPDGQGRGGEGANGRGSGAAAFLGFDPDRASMIRAIHGILAAIVFVIVFPVGAILMRIIPGRFTVLIHALVQIIAYMAFVAAVGLGLYLTQYVRPRNGLTILTDPNENFHPIIGLVVFTALTIQPVFGFLHHRRFRKIRRRGIFSHLHLWIGRIFISLGIINGGLGLWVARNRDKSLTVSYGVVAAVIWSLWMIIAILTEIRRRRALKRADEKRVAAGATSD